MDYIRQNKDILIGCASPALERWPRRVQCSLWPWRLGNGSWCHHSWLDPPENSCSPLQFHQRQDLTWWSEMAQVYPRRLKVNSTIKSSGVSRRFVAVVFLSSLSPVIVLFFSCFLFFSFSSSSSLNSLVFRADIFLSFELSRRFFLYPPCSREQVLLGQHKDGEIVETYKCLLAICHAKKTKGFRRPQSKTRGLPPCISTFQWMIGSWVKMRQQQRADRGISRKQRVEEWTQELECGSWNKKPRRMESSVYEALWWWVVIGRAEKSEEKGRSRASCDLAARFPPSSLLLTWPLHWNCETVKQGRNLRSMNN